MQNKKHSHKMILEWNIQGGKFKVEIIDKQILVLAEYISDHENDEGNIFQTNSKKFVEEIYESLGEMLEYMNNQKKG